ncbi:hypothetical protein [Urbifossiella limnaea]|uniref:Uncharacterized protein n=1 Tax=Urbifossiella limnaea TaxID=2528023 RepID=A0A517XWX4_9BACT|nr:hypothetical protein [Urbifossiella limnaea]QDU22010.1 hypothetical protein ETAA1_39850 [Urbifossiella limnaea]
MAVSPRLLAALAIGFAPGCLHVHGDVAHPDHKPPARADGFASLKPGESIVARPASEPKPIADTPAAPKLATVEPDPLVPPPESVLTVKAEPGPFPLPGVAPLPEPPLLAAMRAYVENRPEDAIRHLEKLDKPNQDFALAVMPVLARGAAMNLSAPDPQEAGHLADQLSGAAAKLEAKAALRVEKVAFCRKIGGFGKFEPWPQAQPYRPGDLARLYVEVRNLGCQAAADGYVTRAVTLLEVRDAKGQLVEQVDPADYRQRVQVVRFQHDERSQSPVRDYFQPYQIRIPPQVGVYTVTVEVRDPLTGRAARSQAAEFRVAGP